MSVPLIILALVVLICQVVLFQWAHYPRSFFKFMATVLSDEDYNSIQYIITYFVIVMAFIGFWYAIQKGYYYALLSFIPSSWGYPADGDWTSYRFIISTFMSAAVAIFIIVQLLNTASRQERNILYKNQLGWWRTMHESDAGFDVWFAGWYTKSKLKNMDFDSMMSYRMKERN